MIDVRLGADHQISSHGDAQIGHPSCGDPAEISQQGCQAVIDGDRAVGTRRNGSC